MLYDAFKQVVISYPLNVALENEKNEQLTFIELNASVNTLADFLSSLGISSNAKVGVCAPKSMDVIVSLLAIIKCNACYIPVDFYNPIKRNLQIFNDCNVNAVIVPKGQGRDYFENQAIIFCIHEVDNFSFDIVQIEQKENQSEQIENGLINILYTSGSTGKPKGVMCSQENIMSFLRWSNKELSIDSQERFISIAPLCFDLSILDIFLPLITGGCVVIAERDTIQTPKILAKFIDQKNITNVYTTPTLLKLLLRFGRLEQYTFSQLRRVIFAGEVFPLAQFKKLAHLIGDITYYNFFGPTETNVCYFLKLQCEQLEYLQEISIGRPCPHYTSLIINEKDDEVSYGCVGELVIFGPVMSGYYNKTYRNEGFIYKNGEIGYRTGDLVCLDEDDNLYYYGRKDRMIKRNGYRIEAAEIESTLAQHEEIIDIVVVSKTTLESSLSICAYYSCSQENTLSNVLLKSYSAKVLPSYMIPDKFVRLQTMPVNKNGKIDYTMLSTKT